MNKKQLNIKNGALCFLIGFLVCQLSVLAVSFLSILFASVAKISSDTLTSFFNTAVGYLLNSIAMNIGLILTFMYFNKNKDNPIISKPKTNKLLLYVGISILSYLFLCPIITCIDNLFVKLNIQPNAIPFELSTKNYLISIISLVILPAICEEILFRGLILKSLKSLGKVVSISLTAVMFAIYHMAIDQFVYPLLMGALLSYVMYEENNIVYPIVIHLINNFLSLTLAYFNINLAFNHWTYVLIAIILVVIFISVLVYVISKDRKPKEIYKPNKDEKF